MEPNSARWILEWGGWVTMEGSKVLLSKKRSTISGSSENDNNEMLRERRELRARKQRTIDELKEGSHDQHTP